VLRNVRKNRKKPHLPSIPHDLRLTHEMLALLLASRSTTKSEDDDDVSSVDVAITGHGSSAGCTAIVGEEGITKIGNGTVKAKVSTNGACIKLADKGRHLPPAGSVNGAPVGW
jgi:hypothetical protein